MTDGGRLTVEITIKRGRVRNRTNFCTFTVRMIRLLWESEIICNSSRRASLCTRSEPNLNFVFLGEACPPPLNLFGNSSSISPNL
jgi:hypothetical protein